MSTNSAEPPAQATTIPDSSRLRIGDDVSWSDLNAVYDRDDSLKENTNPKTHQHHQYHHGGHVSTTTSHVVQSTSSQRFSGNLKPTAAPINVLAGSNGYLGGSARRAPHSVAIFPRKAKTGGGGKKQAVPEAEPGSPKVSCIGKVLSDRERRRRRSPGNGDGQKLNCCMGFFGKKAAVESVESLPKKDKTRSRVLVKDNEVPVVTSETAAPELGGLKKFVSGRRTAAWVAEIDLEGDAGNVERSGPLEPADVWGLRKRTVSDGEEEERARE